jgi:hypothetical protein
VPEKAQMKSRRFWLAFAWVCIAIGIRIWGSGGGDAAIVSGLLFLIWTIPFGVIWQFVLYDQTLKFMSVDTAQLAGDVITIGVFVLFWFLLVPVIVKKPKRTT